MRWHHVAPLALFAGTLALRMLLIGGPPFIDEGIYAFNAEMAWRGERAFPMAPINFYAPLVRWAGMPDLTPFLYLRIVDGLVAAGAAVMCYRFLSGWTESAIAFVMASAWSIASNLPGFVDAGFKNPMMAATFVYLAALRLLSSRSSWSPFLAGLLIPIAVALREPLFPIVIVSLSLCAMIHGRHGLLIHVAGLSIAGGVLLLWIDIFRGPPLEILGYFTREIPMAYSQLERMDPEGRRRWPSLLRALRMTMELVPAAILGVGWLLAPGRGERVAKGLAILLFVAPLYEIFSKYCLPYHWAQLVLGGAFLGAMGLRWWLSLNRTPDRWRLIIGGILAVAWLVGEYHGRGMFDDYRAGYRLSCEFAPVMIRGRWDDPSVRKSAHLSMAKYIRDLTTPDDRIVVSAAWSMLYPLSGRLPVSPSLADLTWMSAMKYPARRPDAIEKLRQFPPRLVILRSNEPVVLNDYWPDFEARYSLVKTIIHDPRKHYGAHGARIWRRKE